MTAHKSTSSWTKRFSRYEFAAFVTGFSLLAYELAAARILAPSIGSSTYVWTSVIGVIIAALSLGYAAGGLLADRRDKRSDITFLLLIAGGGVLSTLVFSDPILEIVGDHIGDPRLEGMVVATLLFSFTSFILGTISPYLAKLRVVSLEVTGQSVALLSAANAIGGIIGTFSVGFIFFGYIGSKETLAFTAALLVLCSFGFTPYKQLPRYTGMGLSGMLLLTLLFTRSPLSIAQGEVADINTPSARYRVIDTLYGGKPVRVLATGPQAAQSGIYRDGSDELVFFYTRQMAALVAQTPKKDRILILGGGAYTLPRYLGYKYPGSQIDVVEIDSKLAGIAKQYFHYRDQPNVHIYAEDARAYLNTVRTKYDLILVDVYSDASIPFSVTTREYAAKLQDNLQPTGKILANVIGSDTPACRPLLSAIHASYAQSFYYYQLYPETSDLRMYQNIIFMYSNQPLHDPKAVPADLRGGMVLTDNYAPVERLKLQCRSD